MSEQLFRFALLRPPVKQDLSTPSITLFQASDFQNGLASGSKDKPDPRAIMVQLSNDFALTPKFIKDPTVDTTAFKLMLFGRSIDDIENAKDEKLDPTATAAAVLKQMGQEHSKIIQLSEWVALKSNVRDSLIAIKFIQRGPADELASILRDMELIEKLIPILVQPASTSRDNEFYRYRKRSLKFPEKFETKSLQAAAAKTTGDKEGVQQNIIARHQEVIEILESRSNLKKAFTEILDIPPAIPGDTASDERFSAESRDPQHKPLIREKIAEKLTNLTKSTIESYGVDVSTTPHFNLVSKLRQEYALATTRLLNVVQDREKYITGRIGNTVVAVPVPAATKLRSLIMGGTLGKEDISPLLAELASLDSSSLPSRGKLYSIVADLIVVRQQLKGYESADISSVQNILKGEIKKQERTNTRKVEDSIFSETETTSSVENENSSTSRYELGQETSATIKEDLSAKGTLNATTYGPMYTVSASMEGSASRSKDQVNQTASKFSRDVVERTVKKITERSLQRHTTTITSESIDKESREFNNTAQATTNILGIYTFLNKVYEAQCWNYGTRLMLDIMVPEPASLLIASMTQAAQETSTAIIPPAPFTTSADQLTELNYTIMAHAYEASGVTPPPERNASGAATSSKDGINQATSDSGLIQIPEGYEAKSCFVTVLTSVEDKGERVSVTVGTQSKMTQGEGIDSVDFTLANERGSVPWSVEAWNLKSYNVTFNLKYERTVTKFSEWQQATYGKILAAYKSKLAEYEQKLAKAELEADAAMEARNAATNQQMIQEELRKHCISIIRRDAYKSVGAIDAGDAGIPDINFVKAEEQGATARFFEQAFEWEQMSYATYGYYWGRRSEWLDRLRFNDPDLDFNEFLKAGMCRVVIPARLGFESAINHFLENGAIWSGGPLPPIASSDYLPIADELASRLRQPSNEIPQGSPWEVRVPTSLVQLRPNATLPVWTKRAPGDWVGS